MNTKVASANRRSKGKNNPNTCMWAFVRMSDSGKVCCGILPKTVKEKSILPSHGIIQRKYTFWGLIKTGIVMLKNN